MPGAPIPCDHCGNPIQDSDLETGAALRLRGRSFCAGCKSEAAKSFTLEELTSPTSPPSPAPKTAKPPPPRPAPAAAKTAAPPPVEPPPRPAVRPKTQAGSGASGNRKLPLLGGLAASGVAALVAVMILSSKKDPAPARATPSPAPATSPVPTAARPPAELLKEAESLASRNDLSPEEILPRLHKLLPALQGTGQEPKLAALIDKVRRDAEAARASKDLAPQIAAVRADAQADADFARFPELRDRFQKLRDLAATSAPVLLPEIQKAQADYANRYEKAAEPLYQEVQEAASVFADERRYADALKRIESFPAKYRHSRAWAGLQQLKADVERRAKALPPKK